MNVDRVTDSRERLIEDDATCDVCVIGSGAGGAFVAYALQKAGVKDIVVLEQGVWRDDRRWDAHHDNDEVTFHKRKMSRNAEPGEDYTLVSFDRSDKFVKHRIGQPYGTVGGLTVI